MIERPMLRVDCKVALITGAATGIGAGISVALARQGADIAISDKPGVCLQETVEPQSLTDREFIKVINLKSAHVSTTIEIGGSIHKTRLEEI